MTVLVAGGGIAGLSLALTCHQIGVPVKVFESAREIRPLGVGINLQPNAVRELWDLGLESELDAIGIRAEEWALVARNGRDVWSEPRGLLAGYDWPQYSVHRGRLQMMLYDAVVQRLGSDAVVTGHRVNGYSNMNDGSTDRGSKDTAAGVRVELEDRTSGAMTSIVGDVLIGADGLHSAVRAQMFPAEGEPIWGGAVLWRGTSLGPPVRTGASFLLIGSIEQRFVTYPITQPDPTTGLQVQNWIAEMTFDPAQGWGSSDWNRPVETNVFLPHFEDWEFDWIDPPAMIRSAGEVLEYPMVDRDPVDHWVDGNVALMGDAAHVMYPVGSNGASQAIVDARVVGAQFLEHGVGHHALQAYEHALHTDMSALVLRNRGHGPVAILAEVEERCGGKFDHIDDVLPPAEAEAFMARYKTAAGFAIEALNTSQRTIPEGAKVD